MRKYLLATALVAAPALAHADQIISFGQIGTGANFTATANGTNTQTTLTITDNPVDITGIDAPLVTPFPADLDLSATSTDAATLVLGAFVLQHFSGTFCIASGPGCTGTDYLSGSFTDAALGNNGGTQLSVNISNPPDALNLTSGVGLPTAAPSSLTFSLSNLTPALGIAGTTIAPFTASYTGTADATPIPEPGTLALLGTGLLGLGFLRLRRR